MSRETTDEEPPDVVVNSVALAVSEVEVTVELVRLVSEVVRLVDTELEDCPEAVEVELL